MCICAGEIRQHSNCRTASTVTKPCQWTALSSRLVTVSGSITAVLLPFLLSVASAPREGDCRAASFFCFFPSFCVMVRSLTALLWPALRRSGVPSLPSAAMGDGVVCFERCALQWPGLHSHRSSCSFAERPQDALLMPAPVVLSRVLVTMCPPPSLCPHTPWLVSLSWLCSPPTACRAACRRGGAMTRGQPSFRPRGGSTR